jgi:hypothetical protein
MDGDITIFFKNVSLRYLREDYIHCSDCHPGSSATASPRFGEEEITSEEYFQLLGEDWREYDPV